MEAPRISSPVHQLFTGGNYKKGKFDLSLYLHHVGKLYILTSPNGHQTETYTLVGSKLRYFMNRHLEVFVSGENLLNQKYEVQYGYPMPGVTIFGGVQLKL
jgi:iron complex outermembrane receptor protein